MATFIMGCESYQKTIGRQFNDRQNIKNSHTKEKTAFCQYGEKCRKEGCTYAHHVGELHINPCAYGDSCNKIHIKNYKGCTTLTNNYRSRQVCRFQHPSEDRQQCIERVGIVIPENCSLEKCEEVCEELYILRVSEEDVMKSLELAIKAGKRNINVEIV